MILLHTNICITIINEKPCTVLQRFKHYQLGDIGLCSVVAAELASGVAKKWFPTQPASPGDVSGPIDDSAL
jgi:predicted nucleic acid-binding protein